MENGRTPPREKDAKPRASERIKYTEPKNLPPLSVECSTAVTRRISETIGLPAAERKTSQTDFLCTATAVGVSALTKSVGSSFGGK